MPNPTLTVYIATGGSTVNSEPGTNAPGTSTFGHMWYSVSSDGTSGNAHSFGFAPDPSHNGSPFAPGEVYQNDTANYASNPANGGVVSSYTVSLSESQYNTLLGFGQAGLAANGSAGTFSASGATFSNSYNGLSNSCVDFVWTALSTVGIEMPSHVPGTMLLPSWNASSVSQELNAFQASGSQGKPISNLYDANGNLLSSTVKDNNGNVVEQTDFSANGSNSESTVTRNSAGAVIETSAESINPTTDVVQADARGINAGSGALVNEELISGTPSDVNSVALSGSGAVSYISSAEVTLASGAAATVTGAGNTVTLGNSDTLWINGSGNTTYAAGAGDATVVEGSAEKTIVQGTGGNVWDYGNNDINSIAGSGNGLQVFGSSDASTVNGSLNTTWIQSTAVAPMTTIEGSGQKTVINGSGDAVSDQGAGDTNWVIGNSDTLAESAGGVVSYVEGNADTTWAQGSNEATYATGASDITHLANSSDVISDSGSGDEYQNEWTGGYYGSGSGGYGGYGGYGGGGYGYYGYYGLAGAKGSARALAGTNVGSMAAHERSQGHAAAAAVAQRAHDQVASEAAVYAATGGTSDPVLEAAKWDRRVVTWSLANAASDPSAFSGSLDSSYEATARKAFDAWSAATGIHFQEVADSSASDIRIGWSDLDTASSGVLGYTTLKTAKGGVESALVRLEDPAQTALLGADPGSATYAGTDAQFLQLLEHEIGHTLGLGSNADPTSVMFYQLTSQNRTLDATDLKGAALLYPRSGPGAATAPAADLGRLTQALASGVPGPVAGIAPAANEAGWHAGGVIPETRVIDKSLFGLERMGLRVAAS